MLSVDGFVVDVSVVVNPTGKSSGLVDLIFISHKGKVVLDMDMEVVAEVGVVEVDKVEVEAHKLVLLLGIFSCNDEDKLVVVEGLVVQAFLVALRVQVVLEVQNIQVLLGDQEVLVVLHILVLREVQVVLHIPGALEEQVVVEGVVVEVGEEEGEVGEHKEGHMELVVEHKHMGVVEVEVVVHSKLGLVCIHREKQISLHLE